MTGLQRHNIKYLTDWLSICETLEPSCLCGFLDEERLQQWKDVGGSVDIAGFHEMADSAAASARGSHEFCESRLEIEFDFRMLEEHRAIFGDADECANHACLLR